MYINDQQSASSITKEWKVYMVICAGQPYSKHSNELFEQVLMISDKESYNLKMSPLDKNEMNLVTEDSNFFLCQELVLTVTMTLEEFKQLLDWYMSLLKIQSPDCELVIDEISEQHISTNFGIMIPISRVDQLMHLLQSDNCTFTQLFESLQSILSQECSNYQGPYLEQLIATDEGSLGDVLLVSDDNKLYMGNVSTVDGSVHGIELNSIEDICSTTMSVVTLNPQSVRVSRFSSKVLKIFSNKEKLNTHNTQVYNQYQNLELFQHHIGYQFKNKSLLLQCALHETFTAIHGSSKRASNEFLEYIGDGLLDILVTHHFYYNGSIKPNADNTALVMNKKLAIMGSNIDLGDYLISCYELKNKQVSDALEALCGMLIL
jgi:hypothetical protein